MCCFFFFFYLIIIFMVLVVGRNVKILRLIVLGTDISGLSFCLLMLRLNWQDITPAVTLAGVAAWWLCCRTASVCENSHRQGMEHQSTLLSVYKWNQSCLTRTLPRLGEDWWRTCSMISVGGVGRSSYVLIYAIFKLWEGSKINPILWYRFKIIKTFRSWRKRKAPSYGWTKLRLPAVLKHIEESFVLACEMVGGSQEKK